MTELAWVTWRQQRTLVLAALGIVGGFLVVAGLEQLNVLFPGASPTRFFAAYLPAALGVFWGAPLLAREIEQGTIELLWTQTVSRAKWLAYALAVVLVMTTAVALTVLAIAPLALGDRFYLAYTYEVISAGAVGYALFAVALGVFVGAVLGRVELAMGVTLVGYAMTRALVGTIEDDRVPLHRITIPRATLDDFLKHNLVRDYNGGKDYTVVIYQPAAQLARLQWLELGLFCGLAALLLAAAFAVIARRGSNR